MNSSFSGRVGSVLKFFCGVILVLGAGAHGFAAEGATMTITDVAANDPVNSGAFAYTIALDDTGSTNIGTLWFAWVPGQDYLTSAPIAETPPTGWAVDQITHAGPTDGYAIRFVNSTAADILTPGNTLNFGFESTITPAQLAGATPFFANPPMTTSFIYSGAPFSDAGVKLAAVVVTPEPSTAGLLLLGATALGAGLMSRRNALTI